MKGRKAIVGLCMLSALLISAFAAQSAMAVNGTTAVTCKEVAVNTGHFKGAHCKPTDAGTGTGANWDHVPFEGKTPIKVTNETTGGAVSNADPQGDGWGCCGRTAGHGRVSGAGENGKWGLRIGTLRQRRTRRCYRNSDLHRHHVPKPAGAGCKVFADPGGEVMGAEGEIKTNPLTATTAGQGDAIKFSPSTGNTFATFWITNCSAAFSFLNKTWTVEGSLKAIPDGATIVATHTSVTAEETLKLNGSIIAGFAGSITVKNATNNTPLSVTTVTT